MNVDEKYMRRCLQLARNGLGYVSPNPLVGAVVVHNGLIIGEGYHREYGKAHAEVNAINSVEDKSLLRESTIYVSLEPCSHYGKTPPCAKLLIDVGIKRVVVATLDPNPKVSGRGLGMLQNAGIETTLGVLEKEAHELNKEFFVSQTKHRPYVYLKWAQTKDGFIDKGRTEGEKPQPTPISNDFTKMLVHKIRAEVQGIMVGTNTVLKDNPSLTTRLWFGKNPVRIVLDRQGRIPHDYTIFNDGIKTIVFTQKVESEKTDGATIFYPVSFDNCILQNVLSALNKFNINSVLVEGGRELLQSFIDSGLWDEAFIETADKEFGSGVSAPSIKATIIDERKAHSSQLIHLKNTQQ